MWIFFPSGQLGGMDESLLLNAAPIFPDSPAATPGSAHGGLSSLDLDSPLPAARLTSEMLLLGGATEEQYSLRLPSPAKRAREHSAQDARARTSSISRPSAFATTSKGAQGKGSCGCGVHGGESGSTEVRGWYVVQQIDS